MRPDTRVVAVSELNVTPMLDVLLVLLIIFMALSIRVHTTVDGALPVNCTGVCAGTSQIVLEVLPGPAYRINKAPVKASALAQTLNTRYAPRPEKVIQIAGYPGASYQDVITAMDIARGAGVRVLGIAPRESYLRER